MNKKLIIPIVASITIIGVVVGVTYAFFSANVVENNKTETVIKTNELNITYTGGTEITASNMIPGDSFTKTFSVENTSNTPVDYNIYMESITNEFNEDLVYTLTDDNGEVIEETALPSTGGKEYIKTAIKINASETKNYTLKVEYKYLDTPQNDYQGKIFNATLGIDTNQIDNVKLLNNKISLTNLELDNSYTQTFMIVNNSNDNKHFEIKLSDIVNTYSNGLTYRIEKDNEIIASETTMPTEDVVILSEKINPKETLTYNMIITNKSVALNDDEFKLLSSEVFNANLVINYNDVVKVCKVLSGNGTTIGDEISCGSENFYVYGIENDKIKMLSKYNLEVGNSSNSSYPAVVETNLQSERALGIKSGYSTYATVKYSNVYGDMGKDNMYSLSILKTYVDNYNIKLGEIGLDTSDVRLLMLDELKTLGCVSGSCANAPEFVTFTSYWLQTQSYSSTLAYFVKSNKTFDTYYYAYGDNYGIRPVVVIDKNSI